MSSSRERFEARLKELSNGEPEWNSATALWCWAVWQLRDAEIEELVEALRITVDLAEFFINREDRREMSESRWQMWHALGHGSNAMRTARALLREYTPKEKAG